MACIYQLGTDTDEVLYAMMDPLPHVPKQEIRILAKCSVRQHCIVQVDALTRKYYSAVPPIDEERESYRKQSMCITAHQVPGTTVQQYNMFPHTTGHRSPS